MQRQPSRLHNNKQKKVGSKNHHAIALTQDQKRKETDVVLGVDLCPFLQQQRNHLVVTLA